MVVHLLDPSGSTYDVRHIFGSNIVVTDYSIDQKLLVNYQHLDSLVRLFWKFGYICHSVELISNGVFNPGLTKQ